MIIFYCKQEEKNFTKQPRIFWFVHIWLMFVHQDYLDVAWLLDDSPFLLKYL